MTQPRIFVSYHSSDDNCQFVNRLIDDLRMAGAEVVVDKDSINRDDDIVAILKQKLAACQWAVLVQTPEALRSPGVQMIVNTALNLVVQQRMQGVLRMIAVPSDFQEVPPTWTTLSAFDASEDYPRALARMLLALSLTPSGKRAAVEGEAPPPAVSLPPSPLPSAGGTLQSLEKSGVPFAPVPLFMKLRKAHLPLKDTADKPVPVPPYRSSVRSTPGEHSRQRLRLVALTVLLALILVATMSILLVLSPLREPSIADTPAPLTTGISHTAASTALANENATATADAVRLQQLYVQATGGPPTLDDPLNSQDNTNWHVATAHTWSCTFTGEAYHMSVLLSHLSHVCLAQNTNFSNFTFQVEMTIIKGNAGGVVFRAQGPNGQFYRFLLYENGSYKLYGMRSASGHIPLLIQGETTISTGQPNLLTVAAQNRDIYLYINTIYVAHVRMDMSGGKIGMEALATTQPTEVVFRNAKVWNV